MPDVYVSDCGSYEFCWVGGYDSSATDGIDGSGLGWYGFAIYPVADGDIMFGE